MYAFLDPRPCVCPATLLTRAKEGQRRTRVAVANAGGELSIASCKAAFDADLIEPVLIGESEDIRRAAESLEWDITPFELIETSDEETAARVATSAVREGRADVLMKGQLHTDVLMRAALDRDQGLRAGRRFVHVFHLTTPETDRPLILSDCAVNVLPDVATRKVAVSCVIEVCRSVGLGEPKVALLSATEEASSSVPSSVEADEIVRWGRAAYPAAMFSGPLAMDIILSKEAARIKGRSADPVSGDADAIVVPDLVTGNALFKTFVYLRAACAAGIVLGGTAPIVLTSRADPPEARLASLALASTLALEAATS
ncbi:MAG: phosphate acyltransferase [Hyphomicrobiaceae bacterium]